ncbi:glycosyltransferase [Rhodococcus opacus]|nr:glycosyltransferase [Rhodococcus opacus]
MDNPRYVFYLAVVPVYRDACVRVLLKQHGDQVRFYAGEAHLDKTVKTGLAPDLVQRVRNVGILQNRVLIQVGHWREAMRSEVCVIDLNPRSVTAWGLAVARKILRRRTLAWGHLHPRAGASSRSAPVRIFLRRITDGTVLYGYDSVVPARTELPGKPVWVAPNSLYSTVDITAAENNERRRIMYVGRLEEAKNVQILVQAFALSGLSVAGYTLDIVGFGSLEPELIKQTKHFAVDKSVNIHGRIDSVTELSVLYAETAFSVSPGYLGLTLTQSLGFGVPMLYAEDAPHSPEIELKRFGGMRSFSPTSAEGLAAAMRSFVAELDEEPVNSQHLARSVSTYYSAEAMANGLWLALEGERSELGADGWPTSTEVQHVE